MKSWTELNATYQSAQRKRADQEYLQCPFCDKQSPLIRITKRGDTFKCPSGFKFKIDGNGDLITANLTPHTT